MFINDHDEFDKSPDSEHPELGNKVFVVTGYESGSIRIGATDDLGIDDILLVIHTAIHDIRDEIIARRRKASEN